ncbi:MAG: hypothetical protein GEV10_04660 [Streptosporangiales bacterium]|nr:hypothetical protein [Streptosporangiales bacterium]
MTLQQTRPAPRQGSPTDPISGPVRRERRRAGVLVDLCRLARPWFWGVSGLPYGVGFVFATHRLLPTAAELPRMLAGAVVVGPLVWLAVLAVNDVHDLDGDRRNPRKVRSPLVTGRLSVATTLRVAYLSAAAALLTAVLVGPAFAAGTLLVLGLGWAYSVPPIRLKARPGADVVVNALAIGVLGPWAGWTAVQSPAGFPWVMAVQGFLVGVALYVPTTLADRPADLASGYRTIAVRYGRRLTYRIGLAAWVAAASWSLVLTVSGAIPRQVLPFQIVLVPGLVVAYHLVLRHRQSIARIAAVGGLFLAPAGAVMLSYAGVF